MPDNRVTVWGITDFRGTISIATSSLEATFVGSFVALDQLPRDRLPHIAVAGRSNVGKSSLLNRIAGRRKLARVSSTPGCTRALNLFKIDNNFYLVDLPGYGYAKVSRSERIRWGKLMDDYLSHCRDLKGLVLLLDCRREITEPDMEMMGLLSQRRVPVIIALTKADKLSKNKLGSKVSQVESDTSISAIPFSAVTGLGKRDLLGAVRHLVSETGRPMKGILNG